MSLLVVLKKQGRIVDGLPKSPGDTVRLPNALALALEDVGQCSFADGAAHRAEVAAKKAKAKPAEKKDKK